MMIVRDEGEGMDSQAQVSSVEVLDLNLDPPEDLVRKRDRGSVGDGWGVFGDGEAEDKDDLAMYDEVERRPPSAPPSEHRGSAPSLQPAR